MQMSHKNPWSSLGAEDDLDLGPCETYGRSNEAYCENCSSGMYFLYYVRRLYRTYTHTA